jgi:tripartite-type tricarboxylate transporter receptor subunit TctC
MAWASTVAVVVPSPASELIIKKFNTALGTVLDDPDLQARLKDFATTVAPAGQRSPEYLASFLGREIALWSKAVKESGIQPN